MISANLGLNSLELARKIRKNVILMTSKGKSSHVGSNLSIADILAVLYGQVLKLDPGEPRYPERDRFILSKGHASAALYAALAECGFFDHTLLDTHCQDGSFLSGHVTTKNIPGVEFSTGSLGHGLPVGAGMAFAAKLDKRPHRVFVLLSDGECDEGSNWEAILFASHHKLDNLVAIVDYNKLQSLGSVKDTIGLEPFLAKWESFGWTAQNVDGHDHRDLYTNLCAASRQAGKPTCIIAHTIKGKGVSFMENSVLWHYRSPQGTELAAALAELGAEAT